MVFSSSPTCLSLVPLQRSSIIFDRLWERVVRPSLLLTGRLWQALAEWHWQVRGDREAAKRPGRWLAAAATAPSPWPPAGAITQAGSVNLHISICTYMDLDIIYNRIWSKNTAIYVLCLYACIYVYARTVCICMYMYVYLESNYRNTNIHVHIRIYIHIWKLTLLRCFRKLTLLWCFRKLEYSKDSN